MPSFEKIALPVRQARSQRTQDQLVDAAEALLRESGLDAATVPAIARTAGVAVGSVYRRFPDKDAVMRAVTERFFERARALNTRSLQSEHWKDVEPEVIARLIVASMVNSYRLQGPLLRALILYARTHPDEGFRARFEVFNLEMMHRVSDLMLVRRDAYRHPHPEAALRLGFVTISALLETMVLSDGEVFRLLRMSDEELGSELIGMFLRFVGLRETDEGRQAAGELGRKLMAEARAHGVDLERAPARGSNGAKPVARRAKARATKARNGRRAK
jgi:AcrR family transcriptional regulator